ncbi:Cro/CI family transcriptional regulator [Dickeya dadantii]|uniref:Cro/CI family transcriptional regulator n=1 Tax=Dickeya dadantii TaxID=204038 RepID=UPI001CF4B77B|nr:Cro/CI family transcriptional regulator [Dickeya dadantii]MCA7012495.1 Cro/CI family transcriptional regulator [Dickeya dadantii]
MQKQTLAEFVRENGQARAADAIGVHQTAISKAVRTGRKIFVTSLPDGRVEAEELSPFPRIKHDR